MGNFSNLLLEAVGIRWMDCAIQFLRVSSFGEGLNMMRLAVSLFISFVIAPSVFLDVNLSLAETSSDPKSQSSEYRWMGSHFAFFFISDDGTLCNLSWAEKAREMGFRFSIAVNAGKFGWRYLSSDSLLALYNQGFEISNHSHTHGFAGLPSECPMPPRGSMLGYWHCDVDPEGAMIDFKSEIERDSLATFSDIPVASIRTFAYPRHMYSMAVIDSLMTEGYIGARCGDNLSYSYYSYGEFDSPARNSWEEGISLFRIPIANSTIAFFGNHSADPPVHYSHDEFLDATLPYILEARENGGIFALYSHHLGDDDDSNGDINYGSAGMTAEELGWMVDLVREYGGRIMTLGEAVSYYRSRSTMIEIDGDLVWVPAISNVPSPIPDGFVFMGAQPNPFNPSTQLHFSIQADNQVQLSVFDARGRHVVDLANQNFEAGLHAVNWNGRDAHGRLVSSGVYYCCLKSGPIILTKPMTLLR